MKGKIQPLGSGNSTQRLTEQIVGIIGGSLLVLGVFIVVQASANIMRAALGMIIWSILAFILVTLLISEVLEKSFFHRLEDTRKKAKWFLPSTSWTRQSTAWAIGVVGASLIIFIILIGVQNTQAEYAFYKTTRTNTEGIVQSSYEDDTTVCSDTCAGGPICTTIVIFTPPSQSTSFSTTDYQCSALAKGTKVEVLYNPRNPSIAKTPRQASADITNTIIATIGCSFITFLIFAPVIGGLLK